LLIIEDDRLIVTYEPTEYDDAQIGGRTIMVSDISAKGSFRPGREDLDGLFRKNNIKFAAFRLDPSKIEKRKILHDTGFYYIGSVCDLALKNIQKKEFVRTDRIRPGKFDARVHLPEIKKIVRRFFFHGKFHEDPYLSHMAGDRQMMILDKWAADPKVKFFIGVDRSERLAGYFVHWREKTHEYLVLAGVNDEASYAGLGRDFWHMFHNYIKGRGINRTKTRITLTNVGMLNIYVNLGYVFFNPLEEYHFCLDW